jgi:hypothetical protein
METTTKAVKFLTATLEGFYQSFPWLADMMMLAKNDWWLSVA